MSDFLQYLTMPFLLEGALITLQITAAGLVGSFAIGGIVAWMRSSRWVPLPQIATFYVWLIRGTPLILQLMFIFSALPALGIRLGPIPTAILGLTIYEAAYMSEIFRAGVGNVPRGLRLAGWSLGMGTGLLFTRIIVPNAWRSIAPAITNQAIVLLKGTAQASVVAVPELVMRSNQIVSMNFKFFAVFGAAAAMYLVMTSILSLIHAGIERAGRRDKPRPGEPRTRGAVLAGKIFGSRGVMSVPDTDITSPYFSASGISKWYGKVQTLTDASLDVNKGEVVVIMGPSGSGKSTFLRTLGHLEDQATGIVRVGAATSTALTGVKSRAQSRAAMKARRDLRIAMVFQDFNLFPQMTLIENIMEAPITVLGKTPDEAKAEATEILALVGLSEHANHFPAMLSGGQQQRAAIGRALAVRPNVILFDEPTSALDHDLVGEVLAVMRRLASMGLTMVVVTHERRFARDVADRIVEFESGRLVREFTPAELESGGAS